MTIGSLISGHHYDGLDSKNGKNVKVSVRVPSASVLMKHSRKQGVRAPLQPQNRIHAHIRKSGCACKMELFSSK